MSHAEFEQEYLANFVTFEGQIWSLSNDDIVDLTVKKVGVAADPARYEIIAGLDLGFRDQTALVVILVEQDAEGRNQYYIIDEYVSTHRSTAAHAKEIGARVDHWELDWIYADAAAAQTRFDLAATYDINTVAAVKSVQDGIGAVAAVIDNHRLKVHEDCIESIYALRNYKWKGKVEGNAWNIEQEKPEHNRASHCADAIRYAIYTFERSMGGIT
jgi:hypothetical protein